VRMSTRSTHSNLQVGKRDTGWINARLRWETGISAHGLFCKGTRPVMHTISHHFLIPSIFQEQFEPELRCKPLGWTRVALRFLPSLLIEFFRDSVANSAVLRHGSLAPRYSHFGEETCFSSFPYFPRPLACDNEDTTCRSVLLL